MNKHTPGSLVARQCICNGEIAPRQFCIENERRDRMDGESWDDLYVFFSGYFGSYGPHVFAAAPELLEALELAIDTDGGTTYNGEDDEVGERSCCGEISYRPHRHDCWVVKARAAIRKARNEG